MLALKKWGKGISVRRKKLLQCNLSSLAWEYIPHTYTNTVSPNSIPQCLIYHLAVIWLGPLVTICTFTQYFPQRWNGESFPAGNYLNLALWALGSVRRSCWGGIIVSYRQSLGISGYRYDIVANDLLSPLFSYLYCVFYFLHSCSFTPFYSPLCYHRQPRPSALTASHYPSVIPLYNLTIICTSHSPNLKKGPGRY